MPMFKNEGDETEEKNRALVIYRPPTQVVMGNLFNSQPNFLSYVPTASIESIMVRMLDMERRFLAMIPVKRIILGRTIGSGGTNSVHQIDYEDGTRLDGMLIKDAGSSNGRSREFEALKVMESIGLRSVARGLTQLGPKQMLVMDYITGGIDSKSIVGYMKRLKKYISLVDGSETPDPRLRIQSNTIRDLLYGWERMTLKNRNFSDFQFMIDSQGCVIYNDPTGFTQEQPGDTTKIIIQAMIDTWEYQNPLYHTGRTWLEFKKYKRQVILERTIEFNRRFNQPGMSFGPPKLHLLDMSVFEGRSPAAYPCIFFTANRLQEVPGWRAFALPKGNTGYFQYDQCILNSISIATHNIAYIKLALGFND